MDTKDLFQSVKRGDLIRVEYLVDQKEVDLNIRDKWNSSPLYYACLCGHSELVEYLLERGAKCERKTFDGERCMYGALDERIRSLLRSYNVLTSATIRRDLYHEFLHRVLKQAKYSDVTFVVRGQKFPVHRSILVARSNQFRSLFFTRWRQRQEVKINKVVLPLAFTALLQYLYTGRLETTFDQVDDVIRLVKTCKLKELLHKLERKQQKMAKQAKKKRQRIMKTICIESGNEFIQLQDDLGDLADRATPKDYFIDVNADLPFIPEREQLFPDFIIIVEKYTFSCHKVFFCGRSDYFKALLEDNFGEASYLNTEWGRLPRFDLHDIKPHVFVQVLSYLYQDRAELRGDTVVEVLYAADLFLLPGLKRQCAAIMSQLLDVDNVCSVLNTARLLAMPHLESQCAEFMATKIVEMLSMAEFAEVVRSDAVSVKNRQETDTIDIIDDICFYVRNSCLHGNHLEQKLKLITDFLDNMNLKVAIH